MSPHRSRQSGFSLLEVLVAFAILAMSIGILMQVFSNSMRGASVVRHYSNALIIAESQLALTVAATALAEGEESGTVDDFYDWVVAVTPYELPEEGFEATSFDPFVVTVAVSWGGDDRRRTVALNTLRLGQK